jgi:[NiFe] hydrogenase assembly HybE family chaperone
MALRVHGTDPTALLEAAFRRIQRERMAGMPLLNPALRVQALGFERWQRHWLGAVVTPWFLNIVLLPGDAHAWRTAAEGERVFHRFGAGDFAFLGGCEPEVGEFQGCSLFSPMSGFADQSTACATARAALRMLHLERPAAELIGPSAASPCAQVAASAAAPLAGTSSMAPPAGSPALASSADATPSRRVILFGGRPRGPAAA